MLAPLSWLKEYVDITLDPKTLGERLTEVGLGCEKITTTDKDTIFELEITPNRPDLLSIIGIAREIAAIEQKPLKYPQLKTDIAKKVADPLPLTINTNPTISPRFTGVIIDGITVKESPDWLKEKLVKIGQRPINNIVDITNYVMFELGNPLHAFDYDNIDGKEMTVTQAKGGESFKSVDEISYSLPKDAVIVKDKSRVIDLCGIKGGYNTGTFADTKTIFLWAPVEIPVLIRRTSQILALRSEASSIFERQVNKGGTIDAVRRAADLIQEIANGKIVSNIYDVKEEDFLPWELDLRLSRLAFILGIEIPEKQVMAILKSLNLSPILSKKIISCTIPTYRNDLQIEEDLIEEVARLYGYNKFPKTMPEGTIPEKTVPYFKDYTKDAKIKNVFVASGFSEVYTYSLISEEDLKSVDVDAEDALRVDNPVSKDYEYLRPTLKANLVKALVQNKSNYKSVHLFEIGKVYTGKTIEKASEAYVIAGISNTKSYYEIKGLLEHLCHTLNSSGNIENTIQIIEEGVYFECKLEELQKNKKEIKTFVPISKYPPIIEDITFVIPPKAKLGNIIDTIKQHKLVTDVAIIDQYENAKTFRITYLDKEKNLTNEDIVKVRETISTNLEAKLHVKIKA